MMLTTFAMILIAAPFPPGESDFTWNVRSRTNPKDGKPPEIKVTTEDWHPKATAIVVIDMWDDHHCKSAAARVAEMAPAMNETLKAARKLGVLIVHSPSDCADFYKDHPARKRALAATKAVAPGKFQWNHFDPKREAGLPAVLEEGGCSCDLPEPCSPSVRKWTRQTPLIEIADSDVVSADGQEVFNVLREKRIEDVVLMGVHTNRCVLGRPFGIRQMVKLKESGLFKTVLLCRDLTDSYHRDPGKHFEGLREIIAHVERHWCPTIESAAITNKEPFRFKGDKG
jgi:nicotinamidase-related amidase